MLIILPLLTWFYAVLPLQCIKASYTPLWITFVNDLCTYTCFVCSYSSAPTGGRTVEWALLSGCCPHPLVMRKEEGAFPGKVNTSAIEAKLKTSALRLVRKKTALNIIKYPYLPDPCDLMLCYSGDVWVCRRVCCARSRVRECGENASFFMEVTNVRD